MKTMLAAVAVLLTGCGGGDDGGALCSAITGGGSTVTSSCNGCSIADANNAADGDVDSFAAFTQNVSVVAYTGNIRATTQPGMAFPAGSNAGVILTGGAQGLTINTYLGGTLQDSHPAGIDNSDTGNPGQYYAHVITTRPFDAVEIAASGETGEVHVYELCSDGGVK